MQPCALELLNENDAQIDCFTNAHQEGEDKQRAHRNLPKPTIQRLSMLAREEYEGQCVKESFSIQGTPSKPSRQGLP